MNPLLSGRETLLFVRSTSCKWPLSSLCLLLDEQRREKYKIGDHRVKPCQPFPLPAAGPAACPVWRGSPQTELPNVFPHSELNFKPPWASPWRRCEHQFTARVYWASGKKGRRCRERERSCNSSQILILTLEFHWANRFHVLTRILWFYPYWKTCLFAYRGICIAFKTRQ